MRPATPIALAVLSAPALAQPCAVGSDPIARPLDDSLVGVVLIHRGNAPTPGPGTVTSWRFYDADGPGRVVTPLLFRREADTFVLVAIGASRASDASGLQEHPFGLTAGDPALEAGAEYAFGFAARSFIPGDQPGTATQTGSSGGAIDFSGYGVFTDPWDYANPASLGIGQVYGPGAVGLNGLGFTGRIYSAQFELDCACPADLAAPFGTLNFFDVSAFLSLFNAGDPGADFDHNGALNFFDLSAFMTAFSAGCP